MKRTHASIPIHRLEEEFSTGISIHHLQLQHIDVVKEAHVAHRHDFHFFLLLEKGQLSFEIDFALKEACKHQHR